VYTLWYCWIPPCTYLPSPFKQHITDPVSQGQMHSTISKRFYTPQTMVTSMCSRSQHCTLLSKIRKNQNYIHHKWQNYQMLVRGGPWEDSPLILPPK
jgi:hypothetical protein